MIRWLKLSRILKLLVAMVGSVIAVHAALSAEKKGAAISVVNVDASERLECLNVAWYYTWGLVEVEGVDEDVEFVPMFWGRTSITLESVAMVSLDAEAVLFLNEPDHPRQSNISVSDAVDLLSELRRAGIKASVSSPGVAQPLGDWIRQFWAAMIAEGLSVDFVAVHWYGPPDPEAFLRRIDEIFAVYGLPVWITEFAVADWNWREFGRNRYTAEDVAMFLEAVLPALDSRPFVERYAWFGAGGGELSPALHVSRLFDSSRQLTGVGRVYAGHSGANSEFVDSLVENCF